MAIDMSQFYQVFFDESAEHLASMESLLLSIDIASPDSESLNAIFRAAHSIKGSSGTFGFNDMAELTHVMESMLDRVRKGEAPLDRELVDACLDAGDVLRNLLAAHQGDSEADRDAAAAMRTRLERLAGAMRAADRAEAARSAACNGAAALSLSFVPDADARSKPVLIDNLLRELANFGHIVQCTPADDGEPWTLVLETEVSPESLRAIVEFVADPASVRISTVGHEATGDTGHTIMPPAFEIDPAGVLSHPDDDEDGAFGFFTELPLVCDDAGTSSAMPADIALRASEASPQMGGGIGADDAVDGSYGFFTPIGAAAGHAPSRAGHAATDIPPLTEPVSAAISSARPGGDGGSIRVSVDKVDQLLNLVGELVISQAMLAQAAAVLGPGRNAQLLGGLAQLERNTRDLQESVMSIRMLPMSVIFSRFPRVVRDLSQKLGKQVKLTTIGDQTELDKGLVERLTDPLTHLVRNSLDHGIEPPQQRIAAGKDAVGIITLKAYHQGGNVVVEVGDDGAGLSREKILAKARERGLPVHDAMSDAEVWMLIFEPGFSTAEAVTEVSGRGVGMDVVKRNIAALGGRIEIESMSGVGTRMTVRLPLTLAILEGISVAVADQTYILPLSYVVESLQPTRAMIRSVGGIERLVQVRGEYLSVLALRDAFGLAEGRIDWCEGIMVIIEADGTRAALFVDALIGQHQVVIKSLEANYRRVNGVSGATIMGDGSVALILDAGALAAMARCSLPAAA